MPIIVLAVGLVTPPALSAAASPVVRVRQGALRGSQEDGVAVYRGVPYAASPAGAMRWHPPQPVESWSGVRDATAFGPICPQREHQQLPFEPGPQAEDCLSLNIWTPAHTRTARLPVMSWIHGGSFRVGAGSWPYYDGASLARGGVVIVTFNYRLGYFGSFAHPAQLAAADGEPIANYSLMDQIAALRWVQENIAAFGGDPRNVTIFGQSAGGVSVNFLLVTPQSAGLFQKAIAQSGGVDVGYTRRLDESRMFIPSLFADCTRFATALLKEDADTGATATGDVMAKLRALPLEAITAYEAKEVTYGLNPVVDGRVVPEDLGAAFRAGHQQRVPYLTGTNSWEAGTVAGKVPPALFLYGHNLARLGEIYGERDQALGMEVFADQVFMMPARYIAERMSGAGVPTYLYHFSYVPEALRGRVPGAVHGADISYVFGTLDRYRTDAEPTPVTAADRALSEQMQAYWLAFARGGDPNAKGTARGDPRPRPYWPRYVPATEPRLQFGATREVTRLFRKAGIDYQQGWSEQGGTIAGPPK